MDNITKLFILCLYYTHGFTVRDIERYFDYDLNPLEIVHVIRTDKELNDCDSDCN
jgi:hypothetical protein